MPAVAPLPSVSPSSLPAPATDLWWSGYWAGFWVCFWLVVVVLVVTILAYVAGRRRWPFGIKAPSWWEHHGKPNLPNERTPKLNGN